jgi:tRNA threonylcarbamoyladenosine biosynthesis protein TsaB
MIVLGIETATLICGAAIVDDTAILTESQVVEPHVHSEQLLSMIDKSIKSTVGSLDSIDAVAVSVGPGSFTGLRIGLSVAKGLSFATDKKIIAVPTLLGLAWRAVYEQYVQENDYILPMIDARRDEVYSALYRYRAQQLQECSVPSAQSLTQLLSDIAGLGRIIFLGDGVPKLLRVLKKDENEKMSQYIIPSEEHCACKASAVARVAHAHAEHYTVGDIAVLEPYYIKEFYTTLKQQ